MSIPIEVVEKREYQLTENDFGVAKLCTCTTIGCGNLATLVVVMRKFGHIFPEPKCEDCASKYQMGTVLVTRTPSAFEKGVASFFQMTVAELVDLAEDDRSVLYRFVDAWRKDDMATLEDLVKHNKSLIKKYFKEED